MNNRPSVAKEACWRAKPEIKGVASKLARRAPMKLRRAGAAAAAKAQ